MDNKEKILSRIKESPSGCWEWTGHISPGGYGTFSSSKKTYQAHRFSWIAFRGDVPIGLLVCHTCDNRKCVNPSHLFLGTHSDNAKDAVSKGRWAQGKRGQKKPHLRGEKNNTAILTEEAVLHIRNSRDTQRELAEKFGVSRAAIGYAVRGDTWSHLPGARKPYPNLSYFNP